MARIRGKSFECHIGSFPSERNLPISGKVHELSTDMSDRFVRKAWLCVATKLFTQFNNGDFINGNDYQ